MDQPDVSELLRRVEALEDFDGILRTCYQYSHSIDYGPPEDFADCFTADGVYEATLPNGVHRTFEGRDALHQFAVDHPYPPDSWAKHVMLVPRFEVEGATARGTSVTLRINTSALGPVIDVFGRYEDAMVRCPDGRWRFQHRHSVVEALGPSFASAALEDPGPRPG